MCGVSGRHTNALPGCPAALAHPPRFFGGRTVKVCFFGYFLCTSKESDSRKARLSTAEWLINALASRSKSQEQSRWVPAFAGMKSLEQDQMGPSFRWDDV
jgi:hypothetical protein